MRHKLIIFIVAALIGSISLVATATEYDCKTYRNHSGHLPDEYDFGIFIEYRPHVKIISEHSENPRDYGAGPRWDKVKKCKYPPTTTTTSLPPTTTTTSTLPTSTTTVPSTSTTVPPSSTTTSLVGTTTSTYASSTTTTTVKETTTTTHEQTTTTTENETTTTSVAEGSTTSSPPPSTTTTEAPQELPKTGISPIWYGALALASVGSGAFLVRMTKENDA